MLRRREINKIMNLLAAGMPVKDVAQAVGRSQATVYNFKREHAGESSSGETSTAPRSGRPSKPTHAGTASPPSGRPKVIMSVSTDERGVINMDLSGLTRLPANTIVMRVPMGGLEYALSGLRDVYFPDYGKTG